jgi:ATP-dependent protease HslVU (ClpYQ) peptidase subunit
MTCIAAIAKDGVVYMAGDRQITSDNAKFNMGPKIYQVELGKCRMLAGDSGGIYISNLIQSIEFKGLGVRDPFLELIQEIVPEIHKLLRKSWATGSFEDGSDSGNTVLFGIGGRLFLMSSCFGITEPDDGYSAIGGGRDFALGSLATTEGMRMHPKNRLTLALCAAEKHSIGVSKPLPDIDFGEGTEIKSMDVVDPEKYKLLAQYIVKFDFLELSK